MASHGGVLGVILVMIWFGRRQKNSVLPVSRCDGALYPRIARAGPLCANFLNGELWGRPSTVPWALIFPQAPLVHGVPVPRHPSQLYEALLEGIASPAHSPRRPLLHPTRRRGRAQLYGRVLGLAHHRRSLPRTGSRNRVLVPDMSRKASCSPPSCSWPRFALAARQFLGRKSVPLESFAPPRQSPSRIGCWPMSPSFAPADFLDLAQLDHAGLFEGVTHAWEILAPVA